MQLTEWKTKDIKVSKRKYLENYNFLNRQNRYFKTKTKHPPRQRICH